MSKYTDPSPNFKLIPHSEQTPISRRNLSVLDMILNRWGLPDFLHEFFRGVIEAGHWDRSDEFDEISLMKMARVMTSTEADQIRVFNRLKKNSPKFFSWQEKQTFALIDRVIIREHTGWHKTKAKYRLLVYPLIESLWNLPLETREMDLKREVNKALKDYPIVEKPKRRGRKRKPEALASTAVRNLLELSEETGSPEAAGLYIVETKEVSDSGEIVSRIFTVVNKAIAENKGLK